MYIMSTENLFLFIDINACLSEAFFPLCTEYSVYTVHTSLRSSIMRYLRFGTDNMCVYANGLCVTTSMN